MKFSFPHYWSLFTFSWQGLDKSCSYVPSILEIVNFTNCHFWSSFNEYVHKHMFLISWEREAILRN